jgi:hypothetical protein
MAQLLIINRLGSKVMKTSRQELKQLIKEEVDKVLTEADIDNYPVLARQYQADRRTTDKAMQELWLRIKALENRLAKKV